MNTLGLSGSGPGEAWFSARKGQCKTCRALDEGWRDEIDGLEGGHPCPGNSAGKCPNGAILRPWQVRPPRRIPNEERRPPLIEHCVRLDSAAALAEEDEVCDLHGGRRGHQTRVPQMDAGRRPLPLRRVQRMRISHRLSNQKTNACTHARCATLWLGLYMHMVNTWLARRRFMIKMWSL